MRPMDEAAVIDVAGLDALIQALCARGYRVVGPTVRDGAIVHDDLRSGDDLPAGWHGSSEPGRYRIEHNDDRARFGYAVGPHSWKQFLFPSRVRLWRARRNGDVAVEEPPPDAPFAFLGVRPCDLAAIAIQDRVLMGGKYVDADYAARRQPAFVVAVDCGEPAATCFCSSMGTGPGAREGFDLALTELLEGGHRFLVRAGSGRGAEVLAELPSRPATDGDRDAAAAVVEHAEAGITRTVDAGTVRERLLANLEHPRWSEVSQRCLSCANCTLVCPTCFCTAIEDTSDLTGAEAERTRVWDTCFSVEHAYVAGGSVRPSGRSRYRQWLTHKFATWQDQFGTSGCTGCGRCIAWCPVGIDVTEEVAAVGAAREEAP
jgi:sulfhydrogenase subunit beta (sulfur reductase)